MFKKPLYKIGAGRLCQAIERDGVTTVLLCDNGRITERKLTGGGKVFGARTISYGDAYFTFPCATVEIKGEEIIYADKAGSNPQD